MRRRGRGDHSELPLDRRRIPKRAVQPGGVVVPDPGADGVSGLGPGLEAGTADQLPLEDCPVRIPPGCGRGRSRPGRRMRRCRASHSAPGSPETRYWLPRSRWKIIPRTSPERVVTARSIAQPPQLLGHGLAHRGTNEPESAEIEHRGEIQPALARRDGGDVPTSPQTRFADRAVPAHKIRERCSADVGDRRADSSAPPVSGHDGVLGRQALGALVVHAPAASVQLSGHLQPAGGVVVVGMDT